MTRKTKRLIIVLGMHRSGTSAITRGISTLGVELGTHLNPPQEGVNPKGFFEDLDILELNDSILQTLQYTWHSLSTISQSDVDEVIAKGFLNRACDLLASKMNQFPVYGFKDPRTSKLLPFWKRVFDKTNC